MRQPPDSEASAIDAPWHRPLQPNGCGTVSLLVLARVWVTLWAMKSAWPWALRSAMASEML